MAKDPSFLFYSDNFLSGTMFFSDEQTGKYIRLLCAQHQLGHLEEKHMIFICKGYDEDIFKKFIKDEQGLYYNERLEYEINRRKKYSISRSENKKGKKNTKNISKSYDNHMGNGNGNITTIEIIDNNTIYSFDDFWNDYDKKVGDKKKLMKKFDLIPEKERVLMKEHIQKYKISQPDKQYRKNPETYLNNKSWNDEIIYRNGNTTIPTGTSESNRPYSRNSDTRNTRSSLESLRDMSVTVLQNNIS